MNLQVSYDLRVAEIQLGPRILKEVTPRPNMPEPFPEDWDGS